MSETCRGHLWEKIIIKLFASSWYIFLTYTYDARSHLYQSPYAGLLLLSIFFLLKLTIYKIYKLSKFIVFTNLWKNFVYLFAKSEIVIGQFPPAFLILFLRTCLCLFNRSHSHNKWSVFCGLILQRHVRSSIILNLWKYVLSLPCPVIIIEKNFMVTPCIKQCWNLFITNWCT